MVVKRGRPVHVGVSGAEREAAVERAGCAPWSPSDRLCVVSDLASGHSYRRALHREYVKRLSPRAPMSALASRLGVDARTVRRYNAQLGVHACVRIGQFQLTSESLSCLPRRRREQGKNETPGYWLALGEKARFPAWRHIGAALLKRGTEVVRVCVRESFGAEPWVGLVSVRLCMNRSVRRRSCGFVSGVGRELERGGVMSSAARHGEQCRCGGRSRAI